MVADQIGPVLFLVQLPSGELWRRHIDHLRNSDSQSLEDLSVTSEDEFEHSPTNVTTGIAESTLDQQDHEQAQSDTEPPTTVERRYPTRGHHPPERLYETLYQ